VLDNTFVLNLLIPKDMGVLFGFPLGLVRVFFGSASVATEHDPNKRRSNHGKGWKKTAKKDVPKHIVP